MKDNKNQCNDEVCKTGQCRCSVTLIWLGVAVILFIIAIAMYFGN